MDLNLMLGLISSPHLNQYGSNLKSKLNSSNLATYWSKTSLHYVKNWIWVSKTQTHAVTTEFNLWSGQLWCLIFWQRLQRYFVYIYHDFMLLNFNKEKKLPIKPRLLRPSSSIIVEGSNTTSLHQMLIYANEYESYLCVHRHDLLYHH